MPYILNNHLLLSNLNHNPDGIRIGVEVGVVAPISGILLKWVNCGKGWRPRWFVLQDGVLSYYKIHASQKIILSTETDKGCRVIGSCFPHHRKPLGELHLKVSSVHESGTVERRFSIFTGTKRLHLKANTREDQMKWMQVLKAVKQMFPRMSNTQLMHPISISTQKLRARLLEGVNDKIVEDAERIMKNEYSEMLSKIVFVRKKIRILVDTLSVL